MGEDRTTRGGVPGDRLWRRYGIGPRFRATWLRLSGEDLGPGGDPDSVSRLWCSFTLSSNRRGEDIAVDVARLLSRGGPGLQGRRCLDVGCGVGGTVVGFARLRAAAWGIDLDEDRLALAGANALDHRVDATLRHADLLADSLPARLGTFDAVTAEDVLEHVEDARDGVSALARLVGDGGVVRATIPNGDAVEFVAADGHYLLPGLTLLDREQAAAYHRARYPWDAYEVGGYHGLDDYLRWFADTGLTLLAVESIEPSPWGHLHSDLARARSLVEQAARDRDLDDAVRRGLREGWERYEHRVAAARQRPRRDAERLLTARFWRIVAARGTVRRRFSPGTARGWRVLARRTPGLRRAAAGLRRLRRR